jgi:chromosome segregation ATPase
MSYHRQFSPSRGDSCKDIIISQLRDEIHDLRLRDSEYEESLARIREIEIKMETLNHDKSFLERKRIETHEETDFTIKELKSDYEKSKTLTLTRTTDLKNLQNEKIQIANNRDSKGLSTEKFATQITDLKYHNSRNVTLLTELKKACMRRKDENISLDLRLSDLTRTSSTVAEENSTFEKDLLQTEQEILIARTHKSQSEKDKSYSLRDRDDSILRLSDISHQLKSTEDILRSINLDLRDIKYYNEASQQDLDQETHLYQAQLRKNSGLDLD